MSLEAAFKDLRSKLGNLQQACSELVTVIEFNPRRHGAAAVDTLDDLIIEITGALDEAMSAGDTCALTLRPPVNYEQARFSLGVVHSCVNRVLHSFIIGQTPPGAEATALLSFDYVRSLLQVGRERGREWREWLE